jgi:hypothetical protein
MRFTVRQQAIGETGPVRASIGAPGQMAHEHGYTLIRTFTKPDDTYEVERKKETRMTVCPNCAARFSAAPDVERQWLERHTDRSHGINRMQRVAASQARNARRELSPAA